MRVYLDASAILPALRGEPASSAVARLIRAPETSLFIGSFAAGEVASAFARLVRMKELTPSNATQRLLAFDGWRLAAATVIECDNRDIEQARLLVRRFDTGLRLPDAVHVALCVRHNLVLVTLDGGLCDAAQALGIDVLVPA